MINRLTDITWPVWQAFQREGKVGFWCKRNMSERGRKMPARRPFCLHYKHLPGEC